MDRWKRCCASRNLWVLDFGNKRFCMGRRSAEYLSIGNAGGRGSSWSTSRNLVIDRWPGSSDLNGEAARGTLWARAGGGASRNVCWLPLAPGAHFDHAQALPRRQPRRPTSAGPDGGRPQRRGADCSVSAEAKNRKRRTPVRRWAPAAGRRGPRTRAPRLARLPGPWGREGGRPPPAPPAPRAQRPPRGGACARGRGLREGAGLPALLTSGSDNGRNGPSAPEVNGSSFVAHSSAAEVESDPPSSAHPPPPRSDSRGGVTAGAAGGAVSLSVLPEARLRERWGPGGRPAPRRGEPPRQKGGGGTTFWIGRRRRPLLPGEVSKLAA